MNDAKRVSVYSIFGRGEMRNILEQAGFVRIKEILPQKIQWLCLSAQNEDVIP
jgi:hypothetical protein